MIVVKCNIYIAPFVVHGLEVPVSYNDICIWLVVVRTVITKKKSELTQETRGILTLTKILRNISEMSFVFQPWPLSKVESGSVAVVN